MLSLEQACQARRNVLSNDAPTNQLPGFDAAAQPTFARFDTAGFRRLRFDPIPPVKFWILDFLGEASKHRSLENVLRPKTQGVRTR
jgi:hypothetical protein